MSKFTKSVAAIVTALTCAGLGYAPSAHAAAPFTYLTQQGRLLDQTGAAVDGVQLNFTFTIYNAATGGAGVWTEVQAITPDKGYFSARLGDVTTIDPAIFDPAKEYYLGIKIGADAEMAPRQAITAVPFADYAKFADQANTAKSATTAGSATSAGTATTATNAGHATTADTATSATTAGTATSAGTATTANNVLSISNLFSLASAAGQVACPAGKYAAGGGCSGGGALSTATFTFAKGGTVPNGFQCAGASGTPTASAVCAP